MPLLRGVNLRDQHGLVFTICKQKYITEIYNWNNSNNNNKNNNNYTHFLTRGKVFGKKEEKERNDKRKI